METTLNILSLFCANFVGGEEKESKISEYQSDNLIFCEKMLSKQVKSLHSLSLEINRTDFFLFFLSVVAIIKFSYEINSTETECVNISFLWL